MATHDYVISNQSFPSTRTDINNVLQAIVTNNSNATAPSTTFASMLWYDTANDKFFVRNSDNDAWIELFKLDETGDHLATIGDTITLDGTGNMSLAGDLTVDTNTLYVDSTNNRVGIGTTSPDRLLTLQGDNSYMWIKDAGGGNTAFIGSDGTNDGFLRLYDSTHTAKVEIESDGVSYFNGGTLLVGKTAPDFDGGVFEAGSGGTFVSRSGTPFGVNRNSSDGQLANFYKDGSQIGTIGAVSGDIFFAGLDSNHAALRLAASSKSVLPVDNVGALSDNDTDLGQSTARFDDIFATNGTIQTSDQNEKQQIASLTDAEITAAKAISKLFKTFKWNFSVEAKGDNARKHTGHIAQEVQQAMTDAGLDAADYAFFCSDTWWETNTEVPAVEAREAVYDDDGNLVTEAIEAIDAVKAHTRRDVYKTAEEAPEGATERTRLGIRYAELLAFIGAATEQRLTSIEARLTALEA